MLINTKQIVQGEAELLLEGTEEWKVRNKLQKGGIATNFFNTFKVVILACGPYSKAIKEDKILEKDLFGDALIIYCNQLSQWDTSLNEKIAEIGKKLCFEK